MNTRWKHGGNIYEIETQYGLKANEILDFSANINPLGFPAGVTEAVMEGISGLVHYPDPGYGDLVKAIAEAEALEPSWVYPGNGAIELLYLVVEYLKPKRAHVIAPGFVEYERSLRRYGAEVDWILLREEADFRLQEADILPHLGRPGELIVLCSPNNPTGASIDSGLMEYILEQAALHNQPVLFDEAFVHFLEEGSAKDWSERVPHMPGLYLLRSLTKCFAIPGLRLGYLITSDPGFAAWTEEYRIPWMVNHLASMAGTAAMKDADHIRRTRSYVAEERKRLTEGLGRIRGIKVYPAEANYICFRVEAGPENLRDLLIPQGILIRSCANYVGMDARYYRIAVRSTPENQRLLTVLENLLGTAS